MLETHLASALAPSHHILTRTQQVCIVLKRDTKKLYAMKYMNKEKCLQKRAIRNVFNERKILESLQPSFIVNLWFAFQDEEDLFFVVDLMLGGDLRYHAQRSGAFSEDRIRLYTAELTLALVYIHSRNIIHRDIKPDNVLMDENGHVHLADFNVAASIRKGTLLYARAGTKPYMAPEILNKSGYNQKADWWSLGVCMYELLRGKVSGLFFGGVFSTGGGCFLGGRVFAGARGGGRKRLEAVFGHC